ncbi:hypothetical protein [Sphingomonas sp. LH128]|uniref:hypothetical protein n=1 Tax=Sphingomonas sp. LH128 TaxID=473781 RepID=UPI00155E57AA|nr:hypothetical protein [Sphingomonas sp. LH128]
MFDAIRLGLSGAIIADFPVTLADIRHAAESVEGLEVLNFGTTTNRLQVSIPIEEEDGPRLGEAVFDLHFLPGASPLRLSARTALTINPQKWLRERLGGEDGCGPVGLDGNSNVLGARDDIPELLDQALDLVDEVLALSLYQLDQALPEGAEWRWDSFLIKAAEVCRDIKTDDAEGVVRRVQHAAMTGAVQAVRKMYSPVCEDGNGPITLRWVQGKSKHELKVYAKRSDLVRIELASRHRTAVCNLGRDRARAEQPSGVRALLKQFAIDAVGEVERLDEHVRQSVTSTPDTVGLLTALLPLLNLAAGNRRGRGPAPDLPSIEGARHAVTSLLQAGMFDARPIGRGCAARRVLEELAVGDGPLLRQKGLMVYYLNPIFAASSQQVTAVGM